MSIKHGDFHLKWLFGMRIDSCCCLLSLVLVIFATNSVFPKSPKGGSCFGDEPSSLKVKHLKVNGIKDSSLEVAECVQNGDFESDSLSPWEVVQWGDFYGSPWTSMYIWDDDPYAGNQYGMVNCAVTNSPSIPVGGLIRQPFEIVAMENIDYDFSYAYRMYAGCGVNSPGGFVDLLDSTLITIKATLVLPNSDRILLHEDSWYTDRSGFSEWRVYSASITENFTEAGEYQLELRFDKSGDGGQTIPTYSANYDEVSLIQTEPSQSLTVDSDIFFIF